MPQAMAVPAPGNDIASFGHRGLRARRSPPEDRGGDFQRADRTSRERPSRARRSGGQGVWGAAMMEIQGSSRGAVPSRPSPRSGAGLWAAARAKCKVSSPGNAQKRADWRTGGSGASSRSAAKMRDCEVPNIWDERGESLIACARRAPIKRIGDTPRPCVFPTRRGGKPQTRDLSIPVARIDHKRQGTGCVGNGAAGRSIMMERREVQRWCERQSR